MENTINLTKTLETAIEIIKEKKAENIVSLKFDSSQSSICDYFLICTAQNTRQAQTIASALQKDMRSKIKLHSYAMEGFDLANWILIDYGDIIIHIFLPETREFYSLEKLWADTEIKNY